MEENRIFLNDYKELAFIDEDGIKYHFEGVTEFGEFKYTTNNLQQWEN